MSEEFKDFPSLEDSLKAIKNLKDYKFPDYDPVKYLKREDYIKEVFSVIEKEFKLLPPNLLMPLKCNSFNFDLFRVRELSTFTDLDNFSEYSYPPISYTKKGRCNFPNKPVFYCSNHPVTALFETIQDNDFLYFFRLLELVNRKEIAPLSYIENQASKVILHRRKIKLLEEKKEELYEQKTNQIKVFPYAPKS